MKNLFINGIGHGKFNSQKEVEEYLNKNNFIASWSCRIKIVDTEEYQAILEKKSIDYTNNVAPSNAFGNVDFEDRDPEDGILRSPVAFLNSPILTEEGEFKYTKITLKEVIAYMSLLNYDSYIGHQSTADVLSTITKKQIIMNRSQFFQKVGQTAIIFKLQERVPEGVILSIEEIEKIGYDFYELKRIK